MATKVAGELYESITGQLFEIGRQLRQPNGYPFEPGQLKDFLQLAVEGKFNGASAPAAKPKKKSVLAPCAEAAVAALGERFDPRAYFKTRKGLYLWNDMSRVLGRATTAEPAPTLSLKSFDLKRDAYDREIKAELPEAHEVELWHIAKLIDAQNGGESGPLLTNGYANIFYVGGFAVGVFWFSDSARWSVGDWELDDDYWSAGYRVFSRN